MKTVNACLVGFMFVVCASAEPLLEGRVRLESGEPVADAQVRLFDLTDLRQGAIARAQTDGTGYFALPLAALRGSALPEGFALGPNYPNPFNPSTIIPYQLAASSEVRLEVFNLLGQRIATLVDGEQPAGFHTATWHATDAAGRAVGAGVYIYRMTVGVAHQTGRMVLIDGQAGVSAGGVASVLPGASGGGLMGSEEYGLLVSGSGLVPYVDSAFRVEAGMAPVELVVSAGPHLVGKATDDNCAFCDLFDSLNDEQEEEDAGPSGKAQATLEAPPAPTNLRFGAVTDSSCLVRWDAAEGATDYDVNYKQAVGGRWTNKPHKGTGLYTTIYDLDPNTEYRWAVRAENRDGSSEWVFGPNFTTLPDPDYQGGQDSDVVTIPDAKLRAKIAAALGKARGATITKADMTTLVTLEAKGAGIRDLTGLEFATNLTWLNLYANNFTNISVLSGLTNLKDLFLESISDISPLSGLTNLTQLGIDGGIDGIDGIDGNPLTDISPLSSLTNLRSLSLNNNPITDISPLSGLTNLRSLSLNNNPITDISPLLGLTNLRSLSLRLNRLSASSINDHIPVLQARGVEVTFDPTPSTIINITDDPTPVTIPDARLRAAIAKALRKASGATITKGDMTTLTYLSVYQKGSFDLKGLESATNLTELYLGGNNISDLSPLAGLTRLTELYLGGNNISDLSPLSGLTNLTWLDLHENNISDLSPLRRLTNLPGVSLGGNNISDLSPLSGLTNLETLHLDGNNVSDVSPLAGLTRLTYLHLDDNNISDVSPLRRLTNLTELYIRVNDLNVSSINDHIPALKRRGTTVLFDSFLKGDFDIELVFLSTNFSERQKQNIQYAARRWMSIIREDLPDYTLTTGWSGTCGDLSYEIPAGEQIDDLRIYVISSEDDKDYPSNIRGWASPIAVREGPQLPVLGCMGFSDKTYETALHEIGHVLGIGTFWKDSGFLQDPNGDPHFNGPRAIAAFNDAGGRNYTGKKVPVDRDLAHWRGGGILRGEMMCGRGCYTSGTRLSAISIQALADMGYVVDATQADPYTFSAAKASAKVAAPFTHAEPEFSCGAGLRQEPIHVVDPQGRIIRP